MCLYILDFLFEKITLSKKESTRILRTRNLSEYFIIEFSNKVDWESTYGYIKLSEEFIKEFENKFNREALLSFVLQNLSNVLQDFRDFVCSV